jgi:glycosyltransferase involved in cell wall biosynthesis
MDVVSNNPSVSVVIPAYNAEQLVAEAIQSVLAQTHQVTEIIVVDDGSADNTSKVAEGYAKTRVIRQPNRGPGAARNTGIGAASGEWIAFLDSDDLWLPRKIEIQLGYITSSAGVIHANRFDPINFGNLWHRQTHITPSGALVRKQALLDVGGFEETRAIISVEDLNVWLRIALTDWQFVKSEGDLFGYRPTAQSLSGSDLKMARAELANIDIVGKLVSCQPAEIERVRQAAKIEYAKNLIAGERWKEASQLLHECTPGLASRWLSLVRLLKINRLARTNLVRWLHSIDGRYGSVVCSGECTLPEAHRQRCMESCRYPYYRTSPGD